MRKITKIIALFLCCALPLCPAYAEEISRDCYNKLPARFFDRDTVMRALQLYKVYQNQWNVILDELHDQGHQIPMAVRERGRRVLRDPFTPPEQPEIINKMYIEEMEKLFSEVMLRHNAQYNIIDAQTIHQMFLYILQNNSQVFEECRKHRYP